MSAVFHDFEDVIGVAERTRNLTDEVRLILRAKVEYAYQRGDLTLTELKNLVAMFGPEFNGKYNIVFEIATMGEPYAVQAA